jgi:quercetin dioxygenase-like cupin family protein
MPIVNHRDLPDYGLNGSHHLGIATPTRGAKELEAWYVTLTPGSATPVHRHDAEEIVVVLSGRGEAVSDAGTALFEAPCTLVLAAGEFHQLRNTGSEDAAMVAAMRLGSRIEDTAGAELALPWRA